ncbi:MAG: DUF2946 family protein [Alphaproteobacteria bacterium]
MTRFLYLLVITAIALANVSPACAFISGKADLIEICTADGLRFVEAQSSSETESKDSQQHQKIQTDCAFCFAQSHEKSVAATSIRAFSTVKALKSPFTFKNASELSYITSFYIARAPPALS